jgi:murein DD-endopeptidase MepM/ murein hydrolase activator NlpD
MRRYLPLPTLLAGGLVVVLSAAGLGDRNEASGGQDEVRLDRLGLVSASRDADVPRPGGRAPTVTSTTTTTPPPPPPPPTTAPPPPPPTTEAPPEPEPEPEPEREVRSGADIVCPVEGGADFVDTWGAARSGGRVHTGTDMMAAYGTPTLAPVSGTVEHRSVSGGGLSWFVHGDDGNTYFGTHLSGYENEGAGWVEAGSVIGYVGDSGNAAGTPHLHFEFWPGGGSPVNPYSLVAAAC